MKKIHISTENLKRLLNVAVEEDAAGESAWNMDKVGDSLHEELLRRELVARIQTELKSGKGFYGKRPDYAKQELEEATKNLDKFTDEAFDWIVSELDWTYSDYHNDPKGGAQ